MNPRRLYRCRHDRVLAGVAGGMAEYLEIDPTVVRILWILSTLVGGITILLYVILAFVVPLEPAGEAGTAPDPNAPIDGWHNPTVDRQPGRIGLYAGVILVVLGAIALLDVIVPSLAAGSLMGPAFLLALGLALVVGSARRTSSQS